MENLTLTFKKSFASPVCPCQAMLPENEHTNPLSVYLSILKEHYDKNQWWEVIPLTAVLLKRHAKSAMEYLLQKCSGFPASYLSDSAKREKEVAAFHLANCIASEVPLAAEILEPALLAIAIQSYSIESVHRGQLHRSFNTNIDETSTTVFKTIYHSEKYGKSLKTVVEHELLENRDCRYFSGLSNVLLDIYCEENGNSNIETIAQLLNSSERKDYILGALLMMEWSYQQHFQFEETCKTKPNAALLNTIFTSIQSMLKNEDVVECFAAAWCVAWSGYNEADIIPSIFAQPITNQLLHLWCTFDAPYDLKRMLSWALCSISQRNLTIERSPALSQAIAAHIEHPENKFDRRAALSLRLLLNEITIEDIKEMAREGDLEQMKNRFLVEMGLDDNI